MDSNAGNSGVASLVIGQANGTPGQEPQWTVSELESWIAVADALHAIEPSNLYELCWTYAPGGIFAFDSGTGKLINVNPAAEALSGYSREELIGMHLTMLHPEAERERVKAEFLSAARQPSCPLGFHLQHKDGRRVPVTITSSKSLMLDGRSVTICIYFDITMDIIVHNDKEKYLVQVEARYRGLLEAAPDGMVVVNEKGEIVLLNAQAEKHFGYHSDELLGQKVTNIIPEGFAERLIADGTRTAAEALAQQIGTGIELNGQRKDGSEFPIEIMLSPLESPEGILVTAAIRDITVRKDAERHLAEITEQVIHSAEHDFLTGLPNRLLLNDRISQAIALAYRHKHLVAVLFLDLDGFKHINDSLGHPAGDKLLQSVAGRLLDCVRAPDTVSRQGGDEFVVLLPEIKQAEDIAIAATRMLRAVEKAHLIDDHELHVTASIGVSLYPDDGLDAETLIKNADTAMYQAKEDAGQRCKFFRPEMNVRAVERQSIEEELRRALEQNEFTLNYQPKINLNTGAIIGAEALIRWTSPTRGQVPPLDFIPIAEDSGLILSIGAWVQREACVQARAWVDAGLPKTTMAVNVSALQFRNEKFLEDLFAILGETGMDAKYLELEVTESVLMRHAEVAASILQTLRCRGIRVSVDDFGTGYSSLSYLQKFPLDALKIDQSFVREISTTPDETTIVRAIISMGRSLNLRIIAEGVETASDLAFLKAQGCDEGQGYYFSRPLPAEQFAKLLTLNADAGAMLCN